MPNHCFKPLFVETTVVSICCFCISNLMFRRAPFVLKVWSCQCSAALYRASAAPKK
jgi:hypothetical protein